jgi:hypothetical protein
VSKLKVNPDEEAKPIVSCDWCGTRMRDGTLGCPRGQACTAEAAEDARLTRLVERADRETARTIGGRR